LKCPRCGASNQPGTSFCSNCGSALSAGTIGPPTGPMAYPQAPPPYAAPYGASLDAERRKQIDRTKMGVLLLLVGALLSWIPFIGLLGSVLILIGVILVILGRKAFGATHARNIVISIVLFILGIIIAVTAGLILAFSIATSFIGTVPPSQAAVQAAFNNFLIILVVGSVVGGLASVFFTYGLQNQMGKMLLLAAYGAGVVIQAAIFIVVSGAIAAIVTAMFPGGTYDPTAATAALLEFQGRVSALSLLLAIPNLLYAGAYYLVWTRINKGEIPAPTMPPGMPGMPPSGPAPPINPM
ncbi:MAG: zinc-ribbon domain-containing protein, partial [Thermoplasmata archaeon]